MIAANVRYALRLLRRNRALTATAVLTLALGIGANTTMFSLVDAIVLRPLAFDPDNRIVSLQETTRDGRTLLASRPDFEDWRARAHSFEAMAAYSAATVNLSGGIEAQRVMAVAVTPDFFRVFRIQPVAGRTFGDTTREGTLPILVSEGLWRDALGGRPDVSGRSLRVGGKPALVVGVLPAMFDFPFRAQVWMPLDVARDVSARTAHNYHVAARLRDGIAPAAAQAEMTAIAANLAREYPDTNEHIGATLSLLHDDLTGFFRPTLWLLCAAAAVVFLIACANVGNLLMAHISGRTNELAIRSALGATRSQIVRQLMTESAVLASAGGIAGILLSFWASRFLNLSSAVRLAARGEPRLNVHVLLLACGAVVLTALLCGALPSLRMFRADLTGALHRTSARTESDLLRRLFVSAEVAISLALLIGAGLLARSLVRIIRLPYGFDPANLYVIEADGGSVGMQRNDYAEAVNRRLQQMSGVSSVAVMNDLPISPYSTSGGFLIEGQPDPGEQKWPYAIWHVVNDDYFRALGIPLIRGRSFAPADAGGPSVAIISEAMAKRFWPGIDPLGRRIAVPGLDEKTYDGYKSGAQDWMTIVGIAGDVRRPGSDHGPMAELYVPFLQRPPETPLMFVIRSSLPMAGLRGGVMHAVHSITREVPVRVSSLDDFAGSVLSVTRTRSAAVEVFAALALVLAAIGVYGVSANWVEQRRIEIGIRLALGAGRHNVVTLIVGRTLLLSAIGAAIGVVLAIPLTRLLRSFLYEISPADPATFVLAVVAMLAAAAVAVIPSLRRALRVDPAVTLRFE